MSKKRQIITALIDALKLINSGTDVLDNCPRSPYTFISNVYNNVYDRLEYLNQVNDFPSLYCFPITSETRRRIGQRETYCSFIIEIRGYLQAENSILVSSDLAQDVQYIVDSMKYRQSFKDLCVVECRTESVSTDEGLLEPYGVVEIRALIVYTQDSSI